MKISNSVVETGLQFILYLFCSIALSFSGVVTGIAIIAVIQHHTGAVNPGLVGLAISYALGITGKLSGLVSGLSF